MATIKFGTDKSTGKLTAVDEERIDEECQLRDNSDSAFTALDVEMIALEDFIRQCPLPHKQTAD
ncbi:type IV secretion system protein VirE1 (plasmid) [Agrobacterium leguminum]|uniref:Protein virE1 n=1 Tax=Agrobacterium deltaense NCPPB 1641 TaxID=1183425 RepID=A0A1S7UA31_9HYPH|nr:MULTISPECIES: hypothetical protein [Agrobacterium]WFS69642.1 type IV secretion system protein VirE1 [Agrobacterium leguminum]CVI63662.1 putative Protein virE1 [Agrobacterium deltaense NCPPB 1641]